MLRRLTFSQDSPLWANGPSITLEVLNDLRIDNRLTESHLLSFCLKYSVSYTDAFDKFDAIVTPSSTRVTQGEPIVIQSGIGAFSSKAHPKITIGGKLIPLNDEGIAVDTIYTDKELGKHAVRVDVEYTRPDGTRSTITKNVTYRVFPDR